jgi:putative transposase
MVDWPHAPIHRLGEGVFFITGATYRKQHFYRTPAALDVLQELLFAKAEQYACVLQAWTLLVNHYHLVIEGTNVRMMLERFHTEAAHALNEQDGEEGRRVWFQFWDKTLTFEGSWLARLRYTHENSVHHGLVRDARDYRWSSASWFENTASRALVETVRRMKLDAVKIYDDF